MEGYLPHETTGSRQKEEEAKCLAGSLETLKRGCYWHDLL